MTLITHFRNSRIAVIAADSRNTSSMSQFSHDRARKVYDFADCITGQYGQVNGIVTWLEYDLSEEQRQLITLNDILTKAKSVVEQDKRFFGIVIAGFDNSKLLLSMPTQGLRIYSMDDINRQAENANIFFSIQANGLPLESKYNNMLLELFKDTFRAVYDRHFDLEVIDNDDKLPKLLTSFQRMIDKIPELNRGIIKGPIRYYVIDLVNKTFSEMK
jgi:hypothetical protein